MRRRGPSRLLSPAEAAKFVEREEARMRAESKKEFEPLDPHLAHQLRQIVKVAGKDKVLEFVRRL